MFSQTNRVLTLQGRSKFNSPSRPSLLLEGKWLAEAGFKPTDRVSVTVLEPGMLQILVFCPPSLLTHSNECATICAK